MFTKSLPIALFLTSFLIYLLVEVIPETFHDGGSGILNSFELFNSVLEGEWSTNLSVTQPLNYSFNPSLSEITLVQLSQIESIGHSLYTYGAVWLMITAIILMLAMVGPILLCLRTR
jgi:NADH-ubiquinone oxidoreductase chain 6